MNALPIVEITENDPRWETMRRQKIETRVRFGVSEQARLELAAILAPENAEREKPDWTWLPPPQEAPFRVTVWD